MKRKCVQIVAAVIACAAFAWAQVPEKVIFSFNGTNGNVPNAGLIADRHGNLYGTTSYNGGKYGYGNIYELSRNGTGAWTETDIFDFDGTNGAYPLDSLIFDGKGNLYGTAQVGGQGSCTNTGLGCGVVFELSPGASGWTQTILYTFIPGQTKGVIPVGGLVFDSKGNLYGTTWAPGVEGGPLSARLNGNAPSTYWGCDKPGCGGTVYRLSHTNSGWKETDLYAFTGASDGAASQASLIFDAQGNLYGTTVYGGTTGCASGYGCGLVFELSHTSTGWKEDVLYRFTGAADGAYPSASLIFDLAGNLYSTSAAGGASNSGTVFELTENAGSWSEQAIYSFAGGSDGADPDAAVIFDGSGNLYGTTDGGGSIYNSGIVFKLTPSNGSWSEDILHTFVYGFGDGQGANAPVIFGPKGNLYGTTQLGGANNNGTVFEVEP